MLILGSRVLGLAPEPSVPLSTAVALASTTVLYGYLVAVFIEWLE